MCKMWQTSMGTSNHNIYGNMTNNKQSSVDILFEDLFNSFEKFNNGKFCLSEYISHNLKVLEQAKAMHKEEIIDALLFGDVLSLNTAETYYKVKFETLTGETE